MHTEPSPWLAALQAWWLLDGNGPYLWSSYGLAVLALSACGKPAETAAD